MNNSAKAGAPAPARRSIAPAVKDAPGWLKDANEYADFFTHDYKMPKNRSEFWVCVRQAFMDGRTVGRADK